MSLISYFTKALLKCTDNIQAVVSFCLMPFYLTCLGLSLILNTVVICDWSIPLLLSLNAHCIILKDCVVKADRSLTHVITSPIPLMQYLHAGKINLYLNKSCLNDFIRLTSQVSLD